MVAYLCSRLAEQLVMDESLPDISRVLNPAVPDYHHLHAYLQGPSLARLPELIQSQDFVERLLNLHQSLHPSNGQIASTLAPTLAST